MAKDSLISTALAYKDQIFPKILNIKLNALIRGEFMELSMYVALFQIISTIITAGLLCLTKKQCDINAKAVNLTKEQCDINAKAVNLTKEQCDINTKTVNSETITEIYKDDLRCRINYYAALTQVEDISKKIKDLGTEPKREDLESLFNGHPYKKLRDYAYHYEFIGVLVYHNLLPFDLVFDIIGFPDKFWENVQKSNLIETMQKHYVADFWKNALYLQGLYQEERKRRNSS